MFQAIERKADFSTLWIRKALKIVYVTSDNDDLLHQNSILRLCDSFTLFRFTASEMSLKKSLPKLIFLKSNNIIKTVLWLVKENPGFTNKTICISSPTHNNKLKKLLSQPEIKKSLSGNIIISDETPISTVIDVWISTTYSSLSELIQITNFMPDTSQVITFLNNSNEPDLEELKTYLKDHPDVKFPNLSTNN